MSEGTALENSASLLRIRQLGFGRNVNNVLFRRTKTGTREAVCFFSKVDWLHPITSIGPPLAPSQALITRIRPTDSNHRSMPLDGIDTKTPGDLPGVLELL